MNYLTGAAIAQRDRRNFFENQEVIEELLDSILTGLKREGIDPQDFLMRLLVKETSEKLQKLPKPLQQAAIALLAEQFLGGDESFDLVRD